MTTRTKILEACVRRQCPSLGVKVKMFPLKHKRSKPKHATDILEPVYLDWAYVYSNNDPEKYYQIIYIYSTVLLRINALPRENAFLEKTTLFSLILFYKRPLRINAPFSNSFKSCGLNLNTDGSEDGSIHCLSKW